MRMRLSDTLFQQPREHVTHPHPIHAQYRTVFPTTSRVSRKHPPCPTTEGSCRRRTALATAASRNSRFVQFFFITLIYRSVIFGLSVAHAQEAITFPPLTGEYAVGQADYYFVDETRPETFTDDSDDVRELMTTIFYPAELTDDAQPAPYGNDAFKAEASQWPGIDPESWSRIETGLLAGAPFAPGQETYPIIVFSPGFGVLPLYYTSLLAEIASHGYVVIGISRTYSTALTVFPDGRLIRSNDAGTDIDPREGDTYFDALEKRVQVGDVWVADIRFMLDQLEG
jgi:hypothetical protein